MLKIAVLAVFSFLAPTAFAAEFASTQPQPAVAAEVVKMLFRTAGAFRVALGATVPISITHAASFIPFDPIQNPTFALAPNTFASVFGTVGDEGSGRLLPDGPANDWGDDFVNGMGPTSLDEVRVLVNGIEAFISFIGRAEKIGSTFDQINFLVADDTALGLVSLEVFNGEELVGASMLNLGELSPGLFAFPARDDVQFVVAVGENGQFLLPPEFFEGLATRPAESGEAILLYGTGYGPTEPAMPAGQIPVGLSVIPDGVKVMIGGVNAPFSFAGLAPCCAGLFQFNVTVPQLQDGNRAVTIERDGISSQAGLSLIVKNE